MIPLRIQLKNFLSYGSDIQTIDFSTYPLICLSGKNGHGKSALLDAITWAIWGQARKVSGQSKADQGLLRLGQSQMMVALDFEFNGNMYRIRREFAFSYGKPYAALDFGLLDENNTLIPLTDKTISTTQAKIEQTLNLTFESFSNSAFLRQGQSNEFSKKSPKERKEILASILGLNHYEAVRKLAFEKMRAAQTEKTSRHAIQEKIEHELKNIVEINTQLALVSETLEQYSAKAHAQELNKQVLEQEHAALITQQKEYEIVLFKTEQLEKSSTELKTALRTLVYEWRGIHRQQLRLPDVHALTAKKQTLLEELTAHQETLQKSLELKEQILKHKEQLQIISKKLSAEHALTVNQLTLQRERLLMTQQNNEKQSADIAKAIEMQLLEKQRIEATIQAAKDTLERSKVNTELHARVEKQFERRKEYYQKFIEQGRWLTAELESLEQKKELAHNDEDPSCPLCEQALSAARKRFLKQKFTEQEQFLRHRLQRITAVVRALKAVLIDQHKELESLKKTLEQITTLKAHHAEQTKAVITMNEQIMQLQAQQQQLLLAQKGTAEAIAEQEHHIANAIQHENNLLASNPQLQQLNTALAEWNSALVAMQYDSSNHQKTTAQLQIIEKELSSVQLLNNQIAQQEQRKLTIEELITKLRQLTKEHAALVKLLQSYQSLNNSALVLATKQKTLEQEIKQHAHEKEIILQQKATLEAQKNAIHKMELEHKEEQRIISTLDSTIEDYQAIAAATSKDGIQALLIEETIPEIEQEANYLLSRLTNNQAHIFIESLRDLKRGGTKETLDIKISDAAGIRPYELFSGGEAFRIDFALRIAISKLLARRAGTSLQTLIIDEGFGSQDDDGLALIMDALYKIQDDFAKVIIVSHLPAMKDQFPVHFSVEKGPNGSVVQVIEQG